MIVNKITSLKTSNSTTKSRDTSFTGNIDLAKTVSGESNLVKFSVGFAKAGGEKVANMVNAFGKMLIAPFIIAFNPISKEDKDTKIYSAWKQPIEAALTITIQLLALNKVGKYIDTLSKEGKLAQGFNVKDVAKGPQFDIVEEKLGVFKDRVGILVAIAAIPIVTSITNWAYPKIMKSFITPTPKDNKDVGSQ